MSWQFDKSIQDFIKTAQDIGSELPKEVLCPFVPLYILEVFNFFNKVSTQWNVGGMDGRLLGLNYLAVLETAKIYKFEMLPYKMDILREIEAFYIERSNSDVK